MSKYSVGDFVHYKGQPAYVQCIKCTFTYSLEIIGTNCSTEVSEDKLEIMKDDEFNQVKQEQLRLLRSKVEMARHEYEKACRKYGAN
jgi:hypothetical protein